VSGPIVVTDAIRPAPSAEEAAAIVAAVEALWPRPAAAVTTERGSTVWRFSGRWWSEEPMSGLHGAQRPW
jgi:hypothetical protein